MELRCPVELVPSWFPNPRKPWSSSSLTFSLFHRKTCETIHTAQPLLDREAVRLVVLNLPNAVLFNAVSHVAATSNQKAVL